MRSLFIQHIFFFRKFNYAQTCVCRRRPAATKDKVENKLPSCCLYNFLKLPSYLYYYSSKLFQNWRKLFRKILKKYLLSSRIVCGNMNPKFCVHEGNAQYRCIVSWGVRFMYIFHLLVTQHWTKWLPTRLCWPIRPKLVVYIPTKIPSMT